MIIAPAGPEAPRRRAERNLGRTSLFLFYVSTYSFIRFISLFFIYCCLISLFLLLAPRSRFWSSRRRPHHKRSPSAPIARHRRIRVSPIVQLYIYIYIYIHVNSMYVCMYVCMCVYIYIYIYIYLSIHPSIYLSLSIHIYIYIYTCEYCNSSSSVIMNVVQIIGCAHIIL